MCFSAGASFGVGAILMAGSIMVLKKVQTPSQIPFGVIPLIFSVQQFIEGIIWLSLTNPEYSEWNTASTLIFLSIAHVIWPAWVPLSIWLLEKDPQKKKIIIFILSIGIAISCYLAYCLLSYRVESTISSFHIRYDLDYPLYMVKFTGIFYFIPTVLPPILSSIKKTSIMGLIVLISFLITKIYYNEYVISVWCFFAAAISIVVVLIMYSLQMPSEKKPKLAI